MSQALKLLRFFYVLLAVFTIGRWGMSLGGVPYEKGFHVFSLVILAYLASIHHAAFARGFLGWKIGRVLWIGLLVGLSTQLVIFVSTAVSYLAGLQTYFNYPTALNVKEAIPFGAAMTGRAITLFFNTLFNVIAAAIGYAMGAALPSREDLA